MSIDPKADFAGQPMLLVRDVVRKVHRRYDGVFDADVGVQDAQPLLAPGGFRCYGGRKPSS